jgi:hypothetical protein
VGAFLAFTLSQAGMVAHWRKETGAHARTSILINGAGAICTGITLLVVLVSKFMSGAWVMMLLIPALLILFLGVKRHYRSVARELATTEPLDTKDLKPPVVLLPVLGWNAIARKALRFAYKISPDVYALHIAGDQKTMDELEETWEQRAQEPAIAAGLPPPKLIVIFSPFRELFGPLKQVVSDLQSAHPARDIAVIVAELVCQRWYHVLLHNHAAAIIKAYLLFSGFRRVFVINVPWYPDE